jgi:hypothetical protein
MASTVKLSVLIEEARGLVELDEMFGNREYVRGMCELIARAFPEDGQTTGDTAALVATRINRKVSFKKAFASLYGK